MNDDRLARTALRGAPAAPDRASPTACSARPSEADDAVQEAWLRLSRSDADAIENLGAWLTTVVSRVCLNILQARRARPEVPLDADVPEPAPARRRPDPEHEALLADSIGLALLVVLDTLSPAERVAFVLHDMFGVPFEEIAPIVGRNAPAAAPAREPRAPPRPATRTRARGRPAPARQAGRRLPRRCPQRRVRPAARAARPRGRPHRGRDRGADRRGAGAPRGGCRRRVLPLRPRRDAGAARRRRRGRVAGRRRSRASSTASRPTASGSPASS